MISYILPTRDRPEILSHTLRGLGSLDAGAHKSLGGAEVIIVDNASEDPVRSVEVLPNGFQVRILRRSANEAAAGRNAGARIARGEWLVMLDDDSQPTGHGLIDAILAAPSDVAAIGAEILLTSGARESGGLPEVFIGCGVAIRREVFLACDGYDPAFHYYAEEYDLAAKILHAGWRILHDSRFRVLHRKVAAGRSMDVILRRLVRNNCWVMQRYAPEEERAARIRETIARYGRIAIKERALRGYAHGVIEALATLDAQRRRPMSRELFDRFTGLAAARAALAAEPLIGACRRVAIVDRGKNDWAVERAVHELGLDVTSDERAADALVIGTLSPGPLTDAYESRAGRGETVVRPWTFRGPPRAAAMPEPAAAPALVA